MNITHVQHQVLQLNSSWDLAALVLDSDSDRVILTLTPDPNRPAPLFIKKVVTFEEVLDLHYARDVSDPLPVAFDQMNVDVINTEADLQPTEGYWLHGRQQYDAYLPAYRFSVMAWEFKLKIICRTVRFEEIPTDEHD